jgi:hypothetical protein
VVCICCTPDLFFRKNHFWCDFQKCCSQGPFDPQKPRVTHGHEWSAARWPQTELGRPGGLPEGGGGVTRARPAPAAPWGPLPIRLPLRSRLAPRPRGSPTVPGPTAGQSGPAARLGGWPAGGEEGGRGGSVDQAGNNYWENSRYYIISGRTGHRPPGGGAARTHRPRPPRPPAASPPHRGSHIQRARAMPGGGGRETAPGSRPDRARRPTRQPIQRAQPAPPCPEACACRPTRQPIQRAQPVPPCPEACARPPTRQPTQPNPEDPAGQPARAHRPTRHPEGGRCPARLDPGAELRRPLPPWSARR